MAVDPYSYTKWIKRMIYAGAGANGRWTQNASPDHARWCCQQQSFVIVNPLVVGVQKLGNSMIFARESWATGGIRMHTKDEICPKKS